MHTLPTDPMSPDSLSPGTTGSGRANGFSRRAFIGGSVAAAGTAAALQLGSRYAFASPENPAYGDVIVLVFLRGGADGLSLVAPYQMPTYQALRPTIRVKAPSEFPDPTGLAGLPMVQGGAIADFPLSGVFAMHPAMANLHAGPWSAGRLAVVHAAGMPASESDTRSHFDSQKNWEFGGASWAYNNGFLNRYLLAQPGVDRIAAVGRGSQLQRSLQGGVPAFSMNSNTSFNVSGFSSNTAARNALTGFYDNGTADLLLQTGANTLAAVGSMAAINFADPRFAPQNGAVYPANDIGGQLKEIAQLIRANVGLRCVAVDVDGWDTHDGMGAPEDATKWMHIRTAGFADALAAFSADLGAGMDEVTVLTVSEFGRTINENGSGGTDHGRGNVMFAMGNKIRGGVYGGFPATIVDGPEGDLTVMNDYRRLVSEVLSVRGGAANLGTVFPSYTQQAPFGACLP